MAIDKIPGQWPPARIPATLDANARLGVSKAGQAVGTRRRLNLIEGAGASLTVADNAGSERVDVTVDVVGLKSATTTVSVSAAAAPTVGQVLTATSSTAATWQAAGGGGAHSALTGLGWTASGHTTAAALDVPYWSGTTTPAVVTAPASGSRVGRVLGWTADGTIGWVLALTVGLLGADVIAGRMIDVPNRTTVDVL